MIKFATLKLVIRLLSFGGFPLKFVFDSAEVARPSSDPVIEPARSFGSPIFRTHLHGCYFYIKLHPCGIGPDSGKYASVFFHPLSR